MRAVLLAGQIEGALESNERTPPFLLRLGDRPFLQYTIEALYMRGVTDIEFVFADSSAAAEAYFGDGSRWGCRFHFYVISKAGLKPLVRSLVSDAGEAIILGRADRLPAFGSQPQPSWQNVERSVFFQSPADQSGQQTWSGWAVFADRCAFLRHVEANPDAVLFDHPHHACFPGEPEFVCLLHEFLAASGHDLLRTQEDLFSGRFPDLELGGRQVRPGVWTGRNVWLHPTARIVAPVYLGTNTRVGAHAQVGPGSVVAEDCLIGADSIVCRSLVNAGSYVGESLEIHRSIVDREEITDVKADTAYRISDQFLIGSLVANRQTRLLSGLCDRFLAALLLLIFLPVLGVLQLRQRRHRTGISRQQAIRLPHPPSHSAWRTFSLPGFPSGHAARPGIAEHFLTVFLPGLVSVLKGDLALVGVKPRSTTEVESMPHDWQVLYLRTKGGLITDAVVHFDSSLTDDELRASECYYSATESFSQDLKILGAYVRKLAYLEPHRQPEFK